MYFSNKKVDRSTAKSRWLKFITYFLIVSLTLASGFAGTLYFTALMMLLAMLGLYEILRVIVNAEYHRKRIFQSGIVLILYALLIVGVYEFGVTSTSELVVFVYILVAVYDGSSQITGQLIGRFKITPRISPNKTLEGFLGGLVFSLLSGVLFRSLLNMGVTEVLIFGFILALAAMAGDLLASSLKRWTGVKDYGRMILGHGGVLDRFDGFFTAAAAAYWFML